MLTWDSLESVLSSWEDTRIGPTAPLLRLQTYATHQSVAGVTLRLSWREYPAGLRGEPGAPIRIGAAAGRIVGSGRQWSD